MVLHKALIEVDEQGSEAAAATAVVKKRGPVRAKIFKVNHPFLVLIRDKLTGSILFMARILDPTD